MKFAKHDRGGLRILQVDADRIDAAVAIKFKDEIRESITDSPPRIVLDLQNVSFIDSSGLGAIVAAMKLLPEGKVLELAGLNEAVDKVFKMTRMDSIFSIHADAGLL